MHPKGNNVNLGLRSRYPRLAAAAMIALLGKEADETIAFRPPLLETCHCNMVSSAWSARQPLFC
jgi:hypothetical protein